MITSLPKWVELGAFLLALIAGIVNVVGLLSFEHQSLSHLSGTATLLGASLTNPELNGLILLVSVIGCFLIGSAVAGMLLHGSTLELGRHYDTGLFIEACLLLSAMMLLLNGQQSGYLFASAACGLQNALATTYGGAIIRTTHVTGIVTDLGLMLGAMIRGEPLDKRKAKLFTWILLGFILGGTLGSLLFTQFQFFALLVPVLLCALCASMYRFVLNQKGS